MYIALPYSPSMAARLEMKTRSRDIVHREARSLALGEGFGAPSLTCPQQETFEQHPVSKERCSGATERCTKTRGSAGRRSECEGRKREKMMYKTGVRRWNGNEELSRMILTSYML